VLEENDIPVLIEANQGEEGVLNAALIACAAVWGLRRDELSKVWLRDVHDDRKGLIKYWWLRPEIAFKNKPRECVNSHPSLIKYLMPYIEQRPITEQPELFLTAQGKPVDVGRRFTAMLKKAGLYEKGKYEDFQVILVIDYYNRCDTKSGAIADIRDRYGIRTYNTIRKYLNRDKSRIKASLKRLYERL
jgi:integrase